MQRKWNLGSTYCISNAQRKRKGNTSALIAAMIDGDSASIERVEAFVNELRQHGQIVRIKLFAEPRRAENVNWNSFLRAYSIEFIPVSRHTKSVTDPNDDAIHAEVRRLLQAHKFDVIALLVGDIDYVSLVKGIVGAGKRSIVNLPTGAPGLARRFKEAGAEVLGVHGIPRQPKYICMLHSDGTGSVERMHAQSEHPKGDFADEFDMVGSKLINLGYRCNNQDPLIPSIGKFWFDNCVGKVIVYPALYAAISAAKALHERPTADWISGRRDLAFVLPQVPTTSTQRVIEDFGSKTCASFARAGGPFVMRDSSRLGEALLRKMQFIDDRENSCIEECLEVFAGVAENARAIRKAGCYFGHLDTAHQKLEMIRKVCLSSSFQGTWQMPPSDRDVRAYLVSRGMLLSDRAPKDDVFRAMASYVQSAGLTPRATYNGRVMQCLNVYASRLNHPSRRQ